MKKNRKYVQNMFFDIRGYFEISVLDITRVNIGVKHGYLCVGLGFQHTPCDLANIDVLENNV